MSNTQANTESPATTLNAKLSDLSTEISTTADKLSKAAQGAVTRLSESGNEFFQELIKSGESLRAKTNGKGADDWRVRLAHTLGLPTRDEMDALNKKLDRINRKVNKLALEQKAS
ncbi:MAG TPA: poly(hydroxyalkanoate) granule-associated protein [Alcanivorax sp.]|nr:poly(hydroxyalkanoate) granule-associated protein [Alcanivorax sp.]